MATTVSGNFTFTTTSIEGVVVVDVRSYGDRRGRFMETYKRPDFVAGGIGCEFVQDNQSRSTRGVLRGLHFQIRHPQSKLVRVVRKRQKQRVFTCGVIGATIVANLQTGGSDDATADAEQGIAQGAGREVPGHRHDGQGVVRAQPSQRVHHVPVDVQVPPRGAGSLRRPHARRVGRALSRVDRYTEVRGPAPRSRNFACEIRATTSP